MTLAPEAPAHAGLLGEAPPSPAGPIDAAAAAALATPPEIATWQQRLRCAPAAVLLLYLQPVSIGIGLAFLAAAGTANLLSRRARPVGGPP